MNLGQYLVSWPRVEYFVATKSSLSIEAKKIKVPFTYY